MLDVLMPLLARVLVPLFAVGMIGATVVVAITLLHDIVEFVVGDESASTPDTKH